MNVDQQVPWMDPREVAAIRSYLTPADKMLEYGCGGSTVYFSRLVSHLVSIEHDETWATRVTFSANTTINLVKPDVPPEDPGRAGIGEFDSYVNFVATLEGPFDCVLVDGRDRVRCVLACAPKMAIGGFLFFHDFFARERYFGRLPELEKFFMLVEKIEHTPQTLAVFRRRMN